MKQLLVPKSMRKEQERRQLAVPRTNLDYITAALYTFQRNAFLLKRTLLEWVLFT